MMDEREDKLDALLRDAAQDYNAPPVAPRQEMWERIQAARKTDGRTDGRTDRIVPVLPSSRPPVRLWFAIAALLVLGVAVGRLTAPGTPGSVESAPAPRLAVTPAAPDSSTPAANRRGPSDVAARFATAQHLGQVESFLTEFNAQSAAQDFGPQAKYLLGTTRLLLDSKRLTDARTRKLLEDLELVLMQIVTLNPKDRREDLDLIADGLAQSHLRSRLRSAIPAGPANRM